MTKIASKQLKLNLHGNLDVYWYKASGPRVETQSLPTLYPAVHPFYPIPHSTFRPHAKYVYSNQYLMCVINIGACLAMKRKIKILIWFDLRSGSEF